MRFAIRGLVAFVFIFVAGCAANGAIITAQDPFAGPTRTFARYLDRGHYTAIGMIDAKGKQTLQVLVVERGQAHQVGRAGDVGEFKLGPSILALHAVGECKPVTNATPYEIFTQWLVSFDLSPEQLLQFAKEPLSAVKVSIGDSSYQLQLSADDTQVVRQNAFALTLSKN